MDEKFVNAVEDKNLVRVRLFISNELMLDPRGKSFAEMVCFAEENLASELYQEDDGKTYKENEISWNEDFLFSLKNDLDLNFSKEKLTFYEKVAKFVLREKAYQLDKEEHQPYEGEHPRRNAKKSAFKSKDSKKKAYAGVTAGGVVLTVAGLCAQKAILASLGVAGFVIGGVLLYKESQK